MSYFLNNYFDILQGFNVFFNHKFNLIIESLNNVSLYIKSDLNLNFHLIRIIVHLNFSIKSIHSILLKLVMYVSFIIRIIAFYFNILLKVLYESFVKKLKDHKTSFEDKIKQYIDKINKSLTSHSSCVKESIKSIYQNITNFDTNYSKIEISRNYDSLLRIIKIGAPFQPSEILEILSYLIKYRELLREFKRNHIRKFQIIRNLKFYSDLINSTITYDELKSSSSIIDPILNPLVNFKAHLDTLYYVDFIKELEEIGKQIKRMKTALKEVDKQVDQKVKNYIEALADIEVDAGQVQKDIRKIISMNNIIIGKLHIAKHTIEFYKTLDDELDNLNGVTFSNYNFTEFSTNSSKIKQKLKTFQEQINKAISKIKESFRVIPGHTVFIDSDTYRESYYEQLISPVENLINNLSQEISTIRYMVYCLLIIKSNSIIIQFVRNKINEITDIDKALKILAEILDYLRIFYGIHRNSMNMVLLFNSISFARFYINKYVDILRRVKYDIEILIFTIKCYIITLSVIKYVTKKLNEIKEKVVELIPKSQEIKILSTHTLNIKKYLESINSSIKSLEQVNSHLNINNLKNNISVIKQYIREVYQNILGLKVNLNKIYRIILKLFELKDEIIEIQTDINDMIKGILIFINYLNAYIIIILYEATKPISEEKKLVFSIHSISIFKMIENLVKIVDYLDAINSVFDNMGIDNFIEHTESQTKIIETLVKKIESNVDKMDKGVVDLECAIEGLPRNLIRCSQQSYTDNNIFRPINDNRDNKTF